MTPCLIRITSSSQNLHRDDGGVGIGESSFFDYLLMINYLPTHEIEAVFGKTVIRFADLKNKAQHGAEKKKKSKNGTVYVYTKNGWHAKPEVMPLSTLQEKIPNYGSIQGYRVGHSGYYNPHP